MVARPRQRERRERGRFRNILPSFISSVVASVRMLVRYYVYESESVARCVFEADLPRPPVLSDHWRRSVNRAAQARGSKHRRRRRRRHAPDWTIVLFMASVCYVNATDSRNATTGGGASVATAIGGSSVFVYLC